MSEVNNYIEKLRRIYKSLLSSRVISQRESDPEALQYFEKCCNESLPINDHENDLRDLVRNLYYTDKTAFKSCTSKNSHLILLTEARAVVVHFGVQNLIYIEWDKDNKQYHVVKNTRVDKFKTSHVHVATNQHKSVSEKKTHFGELIQRVSKDKKEKLEKLEPDLDLNQKSDYKTESGQKTELVQKTEQNIKNRNKKWSEQQED